MLQLIYSIPDIIQSKELAIRRASLNLVEAQCEASLFRRKNILNKVLRTKLQMTENWKTNKIGVMK